MGREPELLVGRAGCAGAGVATDGAALGSTVGILAGGGSEAGGTGSAADGKSGVATAAASAGARALGAASWPISGLAAERNHSAPAEATTTAAASNHGATPLRLGGLACEASEAERDSGAAVVAVAWNARLDSSSGAAKRSAPLSLMHSLRSASAASRAEENRCAGSRWTVFANHWSKPFGTGAKLDGGGMGSMQILSVMPPIVSASKGRWPVTHSHAITPSAHKSV